MSFDYRNSRLALVGGLLLMIGGALGSGCVTEELSQFRYPDEGSFCQALAQVQCNATVVAACYNSGTDPAVINQDTDSCVDVASRGVACNPEGRTYHPETAEECLLKVRDIYGDASLTIGELAEATEACVAVFSDDGRVGAVCDADGDCSTGEGLRCIKKIGEDSGNCFRPKAVTAGNDCSDQASVCEQGFYCDDGAHCVSSPKLKGSCAEGQPCAAGSYCVAKICEEQRPNGISCNSAIECSGGFCLTDKQGENGECATASNLSSFSSNCDAFR